MSKNKNSSELDKAKKDYGTPEERQKRQEDAQVQLDRAKAHGAESAQAERSKKRR